MWNKISSKLLRLFNQLPPPPAARNVYQIPHFRKKIPVLQQLPYRKTIPDLTSPVWEILDPPLVMSAKQDYTTDLMSDVKYKGFLN